MTRLRAALRLSPGHFAEALAVLLGTSALLAVIGLIALLGAPTPQHGLRTNATVVDAQARAVDGSGRQLLFATYEFTDRSGVVRRAQSASGATNVPRAGTVVPIVYDTLEPSIATTPLAMPDASALAIAAFIAAGFVALISAVFLALARIDYGLVVVPARTARAPMHGWKVLRRDARVTAAA